MALISKMSDGDKNLVHALREQYGLAEYTDEAIADAWKAYMRRGEKRFFLAILKS